MEHICEIQPRGLLTIRFRLPLAFGVRMRLLRWIFALADLVSPVDIEVEIVGNGSSPN